MSFPVLFAIIVCLVFLWYQKQTYYPNKNEGNGGFKEQAKPQKSSSNSRRKIGGCYVDGAQIAREKESDEERLLRKLYEVQSRSKKKEFAGSGKYRNAFENTELSDAQILGTPQAEFCEKHYETHTVLPVITRMLDEPQELASAFVLSQILGKPKCFDDDFYHKY